jgi:hypothetical protein
MAEPDLAEAQQHASVNKFQTKIRDFVVNVLIL